MQEVKERLLTSWLMMITAVDSERIPTQLPYNEAVVCNLLYTNKDKEITATDLCTMTKIMKSQMNRILTNLEEKGLIERVRSSEDKRNMIVRLIEQENSVYLTQHENTLKYVDRLISKLGAKRAEEIIELFTLIANYANDQE